MEAIPSVDLALPPAEAAAQLEAACTTVGFFHVLNHGVSAQLRAECFEQCRLFFALPESTKTDILADRNNRGYTAYQEETLNPGTQREGDTKEGLYFGREIHASDPESAKPLHGPNQWPDAAQLPAFRRVVEEYFAAVTAAGFKLLTAFAQSLALDPAAFTAAFFQAPMLFLRPLHYSAALSSPADGVFGAGAHTDYGLFTLLATDGTPGLQILREGRWCDVPHVEHALVVNLGDMAERWTNGRYRSTMHRVLSTSGRPRYSLPFFFEPSFDAAVECLPSCCTDAPPRYAATTAGQHLLQKYGETHAEFTAFDESDAPAA